MIYPTIVAFLRQGILLNSISWSIFFIILISFLVIRMPVIEVYVVFTLSLIFWLLGNYYALRVSIDQELFIALEKKAEKHEDLNLTLLEMDKTMQLLGIHSKNPITKTAPKKLINIEERALGAIKLLKIQIISLCLLIILLIGIYSLFFYRLFFL